MTWTTVKPTKAGWYWWKRADFPAEMVRIIEGDFHDLGPSQHGLFMFGFRDHPDEGVIINYCFRLDTCGGEWAGPLEPPKEKEQQP